MDHQPKSGNSVSIQRLHLARVPGFSLFRNVRTVYAYRLRLDNFSLAGSFQTPLFRCKICLDAALDIGAMDA